MSKTYQLYLDDLLVVAVATNENDAYYRFIRSLNVYGYKYEVSTNKACTFFID